MTHRIPSLAVVALLGVGGLASPAMAGSSAMGEEFLSTFEAVPPNVLFLLDLSDQMSDDCGEMGDSGDTASPGTTSGESCLDAVIDANDRFQIAYTYKTWDGMRLEFIYRDADGDWAEWSIVNDPIFAGLAIYHQIVQVAFDGLGNIQSLSSSNGLALTVGVF